MGVLADEKRVCVICGKTFTPVRGVQKTCSKECRKIKNVSYALEYQSLHYRADRVAECQYCGVTFEPYKNGAKRYYCSAEHSKLAQQMHTALSHKRNKKHSKKYISLPQVPKIRTMPTLDEMAGDNPGAYAKAQLRDTMSRYFGK